MENLPSISRLVMGNPPVSDHLEDGAVGAAQNKQPRQVSSQVKIRVKGTKDATAKVLKALKSSAPKTGTGGFAEFTRSTDRVLASVKYYLLTGLAPFDAATGGFPFGRVTEVYGLDGCGKTGLVMLACGKAKQGELYEKMDDGTMRRLKEGEYEITVVFIDNENSLEEGDRMRVEGQEVDCITGECDTIDLLFKNIDRAADALKAIEDETKIPQFLVFVVDTIAGTATAEEVKQEWGKVDFNRQPKQLREGFRNTVRKLRSHSICLICTNQVSDSFAPKMKGRGNKMMLPQDADFSTFGGKALRYYASLRIFMVKTPSPYKVSGNQFPDGFQVHFFVSKNRQKMPLRSGRLVLLYGGTAQSYSGYNRSYSVLEHLRFMKLIATGVTGQIVVNFAKFGINDGLSTSPDLQEQDDDADVEEKGHKHVLERRIDWPDFAKKYQPQVDALWELSVERMFAVAGAIGLEAEADDMEVGEELAPILDV